MAGQCRAQCGEVRQARVVGMRCLFRLRLSRPLRQLSLPRDSPLEARGEAQESQTGARCTDNPPSATVLCHEDFYLDSAMQCLVMSTKPSTKPLRLKTLCGGVGERAACSRRVPHAGSACCGASAKWGSLRSCPPRLCQWGPTQPSSHGEDLLGWTQSWSAI